jgi:hypothetical protein
MSEEAGGRRGRGDTDSRDLGEQGSISQPPMRELGSAGNTVVEEAKFQLGRPPVPLAFDGLELPWSYGDDRITALVRSPDSLFVFWEITDEGIAAARARLGRGAPAEEGWCNLRVYDTTGRDFDGTNANDYFDVRVERGDREYFLNLHRPTASFYVEIGIKTREGYFQAIARSGRADFPRKGPSPSHALEWMTVTSDDAHPSARPYVSRYSGPPPWSGPAYVEARSAGGGGEGRGAPASSLAGGYSESRTFTWMHPVHGDVRWEGPWISDGWRTEWRLRWIGGRDARGGESVLPLENAQWVVGPFPLDVLDAHHAGRFEIRYLGDSSVLEEHASGIEVFGPWEVRIQSFQTGSERRTLGSWRVHWARVEPAKVERWWTTFERARMNAWVAGRVIGGASESHAIAWGGASEMWRMGASERWFAGASEWLAMGGSEVARVGASELLYGGASALLYGGASGILWGGASGLAWGGASELLYGGASERTWGGASEAGHGGSSAAAAFGIGASEAYAEWAASANMNQEKR